MGTIVASTISNTAGKSITTSDIADGRCTGWVKFIGTTGAIDSSFNVASVTRNGVGSYTVTFATPMLNVNYNAIGTAAGQTNVSYNGAVAAANFTLTSVLLTVSKTGNTYAGNFDTSGFVSCSLFGGK